MRLSPFISIKLNISLNASIHFEETERWQTFIMNVSISQVSVIYNMNPFLAVLCARCSGHLAGKIFLIILEKKFTDWKGFVKINKCTAYEIWRYMSKVYFVFGQDFNSLLFYVFWSFTKIFRKIKMFWNSIFKSKCLRARRNIFLLL